MSRHVALLGLFVLAAAGLTAGFTADSTAAHTAGSQPAAAVAPSTSFRFAKASLETEAAESAAPIRLTASDGTGLSLVALEAHGLLAPPLAFTELHLTFENPRDETIEGRFQIALPPGAALSRFAMKIGGAWQEGEVVERQRARRAYEDFLHRRQDPALLEQEAGNEFSARVFPIPARGRKELVVSYSHALARADEPYVLPLLGLSQIGRLDVRVLLGERLSKDTAASNLGGEVSDQRVVELHKRDWTPDRDLAIRQDQAGSEAGLRHDNLAVVRVTTPADAFEAAKTQEIAGLYVLIDSSASRALGYATQVRRLAELIAGLRDGAGGATPLGIAAFDQEVVPIYEGRASGFGTAELQQLRSRRPLGASDLQAALAWLDGRLARSREKTPRVLLLTDGVATAGETETRALKAAVKALGARGVERLDVLAVGGLRDDAVLRELTTGNLAHDGQRIDGAAPVSEIARRLTRACRSGIAVEVEGAAWVWPETLDGVQPGDEVLVYADLPAKRPLRLRLAGKPAGLGGIAAAERPLLERAWAQARIERLVHLRETAHAEDEDLRQALQLQIVELSVRHRVLSPLTALLVLETEDDYRRFGLDRRSLADILTVGPGGLDVLARTPPPGTTWSQPTKVAAESRPTELDSLSSLGSVGDAEGESSGGLEEAIVGGVEGGVAGGVVGGVPGGIAGGVPGGVASPPAVPAPVQPVEIAEEVPLRVGSTAPERQERRRDAPKPRTDPYDGRFGEVMRLLAAGETARARASAEAWNAEAPGDVLALLALGEAAEKSGDPSTAARAYGSLIDLFPSRADLRRLAGERLERLGETGLGLAIDTYRKAVLERPDHPSGHRLLAWALLRAGQFAAAFEALEQGLEQQYPGGRFVGVDRVLKDDLGLLAAAWLRAEPDRREALLDRLQARGARLDTEPSLRFVLTWETDANDVDLHVYDRQGGHASYSQKSLASGGELFADVTTGYGPECFRVLSPGKRSAAPYRLQAHYYRRGPMGYGMGTLQVVAHDGTGKLHLEPRPFVVMADDAWLDLGTVGGDKEDRAAR